MKEEKKEDELKRRRNMRKAKRTIEKGREKGGGEVEVNEIRGRRREKRRIKGGRGW